MSIRIRSVVVNERGQIVIPEEVRNDLGIKKGATLVLLEENGKIILRKEQEVADALHRQESVLEKVSSALLSESALAKDWLSKKEESAWKDL